MVRYCLIFRVTKLKTANRRLGLSHFYIFFVKKKPPFTLLCPIQFVISFVSVNVHPQAYCKEVIINKVKEQDRSNLSDKNINENTEASQR